MNEIIKSDYIHLHCSLTTKESLFQAASQWAAEAQIIENAEIFLHGLWDREAEFSTGVGDGIAIPHCRLEAIRRPLSSLPIWSSRSVGVLMNKLIWFSSWLFPYPMLRILTLNYYPSLRAN